MPERLNRIIGMSYPVKLEFRNMQDLIRDCFYEIAEQTAYGINQRNPKSAVKGCLHDDHEVRIKTETPPCQILMAHRHGHEVTNATIDPWPQRAIHDYRPQVPKGYFEGS